jgi:putative transposase
LWERGSARDLYMKKNYKKGSHLLRKGRYSKPGYYYFITTSTYKKANFLNTKQHFEIIFNSLKFLEKKGRIELHFVIVMPDHIHAVLKLLEDQTLKYIMRSFKGYTGNMIKQSLDVTNQHIWQSQYYDHLIRKNESYTEIMKYCLYNPVRKGIVKEPQDYPFWWCKYELL